jgi:hypothetical protein
MSQYDGARHLGRRQTKTCTYWALKLKYMEGLAGVWWFPDENPRRLDGISLFKTRQQARDTARAKDPASLGPAVKVRVTIKEVK